MSPDISIVCPTFNDCGHLNELVMRIGNAFTGLNYELIIVDDGSTDGTRDVINEIVKTRREVKGVILSRNFGQHPATLAGMRSASGQTIATIDSDLQHNPDDLRRLVDVYNSSNYDLVYGVPVDEKGGRIIASKATKKALQVFGGIQSAPKISALRVFSANLLDEFKDFSGPIVNIDSLLSWGKPTIGGVEVKFDQRLRGESRYGFFGLVNHAIEMVTSFSVRPLRIASMFGFFVIALGVIAFVATVINYLIRGGSVPGFATLACLLVIFSGTQLVILGIIGEYIAKISIRQNQRVTYLVEHVVLHGEP